MRKVRKGSTLQLPLGMYEECGMFYGSSQASIAQYSAQHVWETPPGIMYFMPYGVILERRMSGWLIAEQVLPNSDCPQTA